MLEHPSGIGPTPDRPPTHAPERTSYDDVPYRSHAYAQTHPDRLATIGRMFGLAPPDVGRCRVLELGCASGGNLIPIAFNLPGSEFTGIDLSQRQVDEGQDAIAALGLRNIRIERASIADIDETWGNFDYILCHGVFSWVDADIQDRILQVAAANLSPDGIAYVSYNTYPGWHLREAVRHMMRYHAGKFDEPVEQIDQARALLAFLASASQGSGSYGDLLNREVERLARVSDDYLFHEHLEQTNTPMYFHQFIERAEHAGLQFLSEASISDMLTSRFPAPVAETLERISPDILHVEQYMDFVRNRQFRQTLLVHKAQRPKRALTPAFLQGLLVSSAAVPTVAPIDLRSPEPIQLTIGTQRANVSLLGTKAAFAVMTERWPQAIGVEDLCAVALDRAAPYLGPVTRDEARRGIMGDLFGGVMYGMVGVHTHPPACTGTLSDQPCVHPLAAYQAGRGPMVANAHHQMVEIDPFTAEVIALANGARRLDEILDALMILVDRGAIRVEQDGEVVAAPEQARAMVSRRLEKALASLTRSALLVA